MCLAVQVDAAERLVWPYEFCTRTTLPGNPAELFVALTSGVTLSAMLAMKRIGGTVRVEFVFVVLFGGGGAAMGPAKRHLGRTVLPTHDSLNVAWTEPAAQLISCRRWT